MSTEVVTHLNAYFIGFGQSVAAKGISHNQSSIPQLGTLNILQEFCQDFVDSSGVRRKNPHHPSRSPRQNREGAHKCRQCDQTFSSHTTLSFHKRAIHDKILNICVCGKSYKYRPSFLRHRATCFIYLSQQRN